MYGSRRKYYSGGRGINLRLVIIAIAVVLVVVMIVAMTGSNLSVMDSVEINSIQKSGTLTVGIRDDVPGFSMDGEGLEIELAKKIGEKIFPDKTENSTTFCRISSSMLSSHLSDDSIDIALMLVPCDSAYQSTKYAYSSVYYVDDCIFVASSANPGITVEGMTIGAIENSIFELRAKDYVAAHNEKAKVLQYASYDMLLSAVARGSVTTACLSRTYYNMYESEYNVTPLDIELPSVSYAAVCSTSSPAIATVASLVIGELRESGELDQMIEKYLGK